MCVWDQIFHLKIPKYEGKQGGCFGNDLATFLSHEISNNVQENVSTYLFVLDLRKKSKSNNCYKKGK